MMKVKNQVHPCRNSVYLKYTLNGCQTHKKVYFICTLKYTLSILTRSILKVLYFWSLKKYT